MLTVAVVTITLEELAHPISLYLIVELIEYGGHFALVVLLGTVDIEVTKADNLALGLGHYLTNVAVKGQLAVCVGIEGILVFVTFDESVVTVAVGRGAGGVHKRNAMVDGEVEKHFAVFVIGLHHVVYIIFHGIGAGTFVEDGINFSAGIYISLYVGSEAVFVMVVEEFQTAQVFIVLSVLQVIDDEDVGATLTIEFLYNVAADEAGTAGNDNHIVSSCWVLSS